MSNHLMTWFYSEILSELFFIVKCFQWGNAINIAKLQVYSHTLIKGFWCFSAFITLELII